MCQGSDATAAGPAGSARSRITAAFIPTLDEAARAVEGWHDLTPIQRRDLRSALAAVGKICAQYDAWQARERHGAGPAGAQPPVLMSCASLSGRLFHRAPRAYGLRDERFANILTGLRFVLRRLGLHAPAERGPGSLAAAWRGLYTRLPTEQQKAALVGFLRFCSQEAIAPGQVTVETVGDFERWLTGWTLCRDAASHRRGVVTAWNRAVGAIAEWPPHEFRLPRTREPYTFPFSIFPASFQADVDAFARNLGYNDPDVIFGDDVFPADGETAAPRRRRAARPTTVRTRVFQIRMAAAGLVHTGTPPEAIDGLHALVQPVARPRASISFFYERSGRRPGSNAGGVAEVLRQIALYHCRLPAKEVALISRWAANVGQKRQSSMTAKNLTRLRSLVEPQTQLMLLHLPERLMEMAQATERPVRAARLALRAVAIEILLICPLRLSNLQLLCLERNLQRPDPRGGLFTHLSFAEREMKNEAPLDWPIPRETAELLNRYLRQYRPSLCAPGNPYLFPGEGLQPLSVNTMGNAVRAPIADEIGAVVHPHLLRHFAAWCHLRRHPGAYEAVRRILNHKDIETTIAFYCGLEAEFAAEEFDRTVLEERRQTRAQARAAFGRLPARLRRKGA